MLDGQSGIVRTSQASHASPVQVRPDTPRAVCHDQVTQSELEELRHLNHQVRQLKARRDRVRATVIASLDRGAPVEHGRLTARVKRTPYRFLNAKTLLPLLGRAEVARLKERIVPTTIPRLELEER
jgi:hypothetical protein